MHPQLTLLLEIQDLRMQRRELSSEETAEELEKEHFDLDVDEAVDELSRRIEELEEELEPRVRTAYRRITGSKERIVVPVISGTCYGCFVQIPAATLGDTEPHSTLRTCDNCGSFLYIIS